LNFWGSWCPPCRAEYPSIQKLYDAKKDKVAFVLIAMQDEEEKVKKFLADNNYTTPVYFATSPLSEKMLPKVFPTTFILGKNGRILMKEDAAKDWNSESVHQFLESVNP
ncbi:TlpA family protein disulfide reductase, partial [Cloacibacterium normanense]